MFEGLSPELYDVSHEHYEGAVGLVEAVLERFSVLMVVANPDAAEPGNLSATRVDADQPVAVFAGNRTGCDPGGPEPCSADQLEEQLRPSSSAGQRYLAPRSLPRRQRGVPEIDRWRLTATGQLAELQYVAGRPAGAPTQFEANQSVEFAADASFLVEATAPVVVAQLLSPADAQRGVARYHSRPCAVPPS